MVFEVLVCPDDIGATAYASRAYLATALMQFIERDRPAFHSRELESVGRDSVGVDDTRIALMDRSGTYLCSLPSSLCAVHTCAGIEPQTRLPAARICAASL